MPKLQTDIICSNGPSSAEEIVEVIIPPEDWPDAYMELQAALEKSCQEIEDETWNKKHQQKRLAFL